MAEEMNIVGDASSGSHANSVAAFDSFHSTGGRETFKIAVVQMDSGTDKASNLRVVAQAIEEAAAAGARAICFPEVMNQIPASDGSCELESIPGQTTNLLMQKAHMHGVFIHGGSISERIEGEDRSFNTAVIVSPEGQIISCYRKMHTFDITLPDGTACAESKHVKPGSDISVVNTQLGTWGTAICYDLRFPELFRLITLAGAQVVFVPANFTRPTGRDHWEVLVRARAIENGCYVVATNQCGSKPDFAAFGTSMVVDPWGNVVARALEDEPEIVYADIDLAYVAQVRAQLPSLTNRRSDVYELHLV